MVSSDPDTILSLIPRIFQWENEMSSCIDLRAAALFIYMEFHALSEKNTDNDHCNGNDPDD